MAKNARYRWQNERRHGLLKPDKNRPATTYKQVQLIKKLRDELGLPSGDVTQDRRKASTQIGELLERKKARGSNQTKRASNREASRAEVRQVGCPTCGAAQGESCKRSNSDVPRLSNHQARVVEARQQGIAA